MTPRSQCEVIGKFHKAGQMAKKSRYNASLIFGNFKTVIYAVLYSISQLGVQLCLVLVSVNSVIDLLGDCANSYI